MTNAALLELQSRYGPALDEEVRRWVHFRSSPTLHYGMLSYQLGYVDETLTRASTAGGKRFRPILCLLSCEAVSDVWDVALTTAAGIELLHNFSLIHDDIEDRDPARRHRPTVWKVWGEPQAINAGDGMFALAARAVMETNIAARALVPVTRAFHDMSLALTEGQFLDMQFESRQDVTSDEYLDMVGRKTGALVAFSCQAGAIIGGAGEDVGDALHTFGHELGTAFQIHDDIQGIWGASAATGKAAAKDLENRKKTLPVLLALERSSGRDHASLQDFYLGRTDAVEAVLEVLETLGTRILSQQVMERHRQQALAALDTVPIHPGHRQFFASLAAELTGQ